MFIKLIFLITYFILLFLVVRFLDVCLDTLGVFHLGNVAIFDSLPTHLQEYFSFTSSRKEDVVQENNYNDDISESKPDESLFNSLEFTDDETEFHSYDDYIEQVEDTKSSVWVVRIYPIGQTDHIIQQKEWKKLKQSLKPFKIKTGSYKCRLDPRLCIYQKVYDPTFVLSMPKGFHSKGNVSFYLYDSKEHRKTKSVKSRNIFSWIKKKLYLRVKRVHSLAEIISPTTARYQSKKYASPSLSFIYKSNKRFPPMLLTALSVKFTGRIKFYLLETSEQMKHESIAMNSFSTYQYGSHKGENFSYSCIELFLRTLHPEVNDIFIFSVILLNMACWLELFLQKGGPLKRLLYYMWGFTVTNALLVFIWLPIIQVLCLPQIQPILQIFLKTLQKLMLTNIAAVVRQDFLQITQHLHFVFVGFVVYGIALGYLRIKFRSETGEATSLGNLFSSDLEEIREMIRSLIQFMTPSLQIYRFEERIDRILYRLMYPDLWLHSFQSNDYIQYLPKWQYCFCENNMDSDIDSAFSDTEMSSQSETDEHITDKSQIPAYIIPNNECVICLESYKCHDFLMGISCGHSFHQQCLQTWLLSVNSQHRCPVCRWPADVTKGKCEVIDVAE